ncbi:MAG: MlaD family protein, partial [Alphaproteobacteria bacterium]
GYTLRAHFGRIDGLAEGAEVRLAGIRVGSVGRARLDVESNEVIVDLSIDFDVRVPRDSAAKIVSSSLLGGKYVLLSAGGDSDMLLPGDSFEYSQDSVILEQVLARIVEQAERRRALQQEEARAASMQD